MAKYIIHACNNRMWYVQEYLVPSMFEQGINKADIIVECDVKQEGNLANTLRIFETIKDEEGGYWHLQDDVIISSDFKKRTEEYDEGVVAGFASTYDSDIYFGTNEEVPSGEVPVHKCWYSFCCIHIPNSLIKEFLQWWHTIALTDGEVIRVCLNTKKNDDYAFRLWLFAYHPEMTAYNIKPNIVDHIDYLLGGSICNRTRGDRNVRSLYWEEQELVNELEKKLNESGKEAN